MSSYLPIKAKWRIYMSVNKAITSSDNGLSLFGTKALSEPMLAYH